MKRPNRGQIKAAIEILSTNLGILQAGESDKALSICGAVLECLCWVNGDSERFMTLLLRIAEVIERNGGLVDEQNKPVDLALALATGRKR
jgi:hypothetical protein